MDFYLDDCAFSKHLVLLLQQSGLMVPSSQWVPRITRPPQASN
jgi:hypothetical protein